MNKKRTSCMRFCIQQRMINARYTYQAGVTMPLWSIIKVRGFGPVFKTFEECNTWLQQAKPSI